MADKILIVDDDVDSLKLIGLMLQRHGYEVITLNQGTEAVSLAKAQQPDIVILDVMMPDINGLEVARGLRANEITRNIPIIMFTAKTLIDDKVKGFEAGADDYLTKPTHPAELASRVQALISRKRAQKQLSQGVSSGIAIGVLGSKGGVGTTTVAVNLAAMLQKKGSAPVLADFRLGAGTIGLMLGTNTRGMANVLLNTALNEEAIQQQLITHQSGLRALLSSANPQEAQLSPSTEAVETIVKELRKIGEPAIFDLGAGMTSTARAAIQHLDRVLLVVEPNPISLALGQAQCRAIDELIGNDKISVVVVQRTPSDLQTPWPEIETILKHEVIAILAAAPDLAIQSILKKTPMVDLEPTAVVPGQLAKLAADLQTRIRSIEEKRIST